MEFIRENKEIRDPFSTSPNPDLFYFTADFVDCLQRLETSIRLKRGMNVVFGDVGTGKTTLARILLRLFGRNRDYLLRMVFDPQFESPEEFLRYLLDLFEVRSNATTVLEMKEALQNFLFFKGVKENKTIVLIVDEAQKVGPEQLEILRTFLNYETNEHKLLQSVMFGQLEFKETVRTMPNFVDRINFSCTLKPMPKEDAVRMIEYRLRKTNSEGKIAFSREAFDLIYQHSSGFPRKLLSLCHQAYLSKLVGDLDCISTETVVDVIKRREALYV